MDVMIGRLHWAVVAMLGLDQIIWPFVRPPFRPCVSNMAANATKAFSKVLRNPAGTGKSAIWFGLRNVLLCVGMYHIILFYCCEILDMARKLYCLCSLVTDHPESWNFMA